MGNWSIELGERPLHANRFIRAFVGNNVSHSFVRIKNDQHKPVLELHGLYSTGAGAILNTIAETVTGRPRHFSRLHVLALTGDRLMGIFAAHSKITDTVEITGPEDVILRDAECMIRAARVINKDNLNYAFDLRKTSPGGERCHSVSAELLRRVGIELTGQHGTFDTPGRDTNLEATDPKLKFIGINRTASLSKIKKLINTELKTFSPDSLNSIWLKREPKLPAHLSAPRGRGLHGHLSAGSGSGS